MTVFHTLFILLVFSFSCKEASSNKLIDLPAAQLQTPVDITVKDAKELIKNTPELVILDVRTPDETAEGMIDGAIEIDYKSDDFEKKVAQLDRNKTYLVYCRSGSRSNKAAQLMAKLGFTDLYLLSGGYLEWKDQ